MRGQEGRCLSLPIAAHGMAVSDDGVPRFESPVIGFPLSSTASAPGPSVKNISLKEENTRSPSHVLSYDVSEMMISLLALAAFLGMNRDCQRIRGDRLHASVSSQRRRNPSPTGRNQVNPYSHPRVAENTREIIPTLFSTTILSLLMSEKPLCRCGGELVKRMWETETGLCESEIYCRSCGSDTPVTGFPVEFTGSQPTESSSNHTPESSSKNSPEHDEDIDELVPL